MFWVKLLKLTLTPLVTPCGASLPRPSWVLDIFLWLTRIIDTNFRPNRAESTQAFDLFDPRGAKGVPKSRLQGTKARNILTYLKLTWKMLSANLFIFNVFLRKNALIQVVLYRAHRWSKHSITLMLHIYYTAQHCHTYTVKH